MTNTLTWNFKPIALPKINSNLLSTISFFLICCFVFMAAAAIVEAICDEESDDLIAAEKAYAITGLALGLAEAGLAVAALAMNPIGVGIALASIGVAAVAHASNGADLQIAAEAYWDCIHRHTASGGCGSGTCNG